jgi:hypothetical protein
MKSILKPLPKIIPVLGAPSWSPAKLSNLALWLRSDSGLYQDTGKLTPGSSDGDVVGAWEDLSGNGNDVLQATTGFKPILQNEVGELVNGYPIVSFDGADDYLAVDLGSGFDGNCALSVGIVASCDADRTEAFWGFGGTSPRIGGGYNIGGGYFNIFQWGGHYSKVDSSSTDPVIHISTHDTDNAIDIWLNSEAGSDLGTPAVLANQSEFRLGSIYTSLNADVDICEIVVMNSVLTAGELDNLQNYFSKRYRITLV